MSLINKVLNELEKRKQGVTASQSEVLSGMHTAIQKVQAATVKKITIVILVILLGAGTVVALKPLITKSVALIHSLKLSQLLFPKTKATTLAPTVKPTAPPQVAVANLNNVTIATDDNKTVLEFILSMPAIYYVEHSADQQQLIITLNNTHLPGNYPVPLDKSFITSLITKQDGNNVQIVLAVLPGTQVSELQLSKQPQFTLHMTLINPQLVNNKMSKSVAPVPLEQQAETRYNQITQLIAQSHTQEAITQLHLFIGDFPNHLLARETLAALLIKSGNLDQASAIINLGLKKYANYIPLIKLKAQLLASQGKVAEALATLQQDAPSLESDPEYFALLAALYQQNGKYALAAEIYQQLITLPEAKSVWWAGLGIALEATGKRNAAQDAYQRAFTGDDIAPELRAFLATKIK